MYSPCTFKQESCAWRLHSAYLIWCHNSLTIPPEVTQLRVISFQSGFHSWLKRHNFGASLIRTWRLRGLPCKRCLGDVGNVKSHMTFLQHCPDLCLRGTQHSTWGILRRLLWVTTLG